MVDILRADKCTPELEETIAEMFEDKPWDGDQIGHVHNVRYAMIVAIRTIIANVPPCPDRSTAIRKIREASRDCNGAITHHGKW